MKIFFVADLHGSLYYARRAMNAYEKENAHQIVILGDVLSPGGWKPPREYSREETAKLLNKFAGRIIAVQGNCDSKADDDLLDFHITAEYCFVLWGGKRLFLTHGHTYNEDNLPKIAAGDALVSGHTHIPKAGSESGVFILNPGSISLPKDRNCNSYGILEKDVFRVKKINGEIISELELR